MLKITHIWNCYLSFLGYRDSKLILSKFHKKDSGKLKRGFYGFMYYFGSYIYPLILFCFLGSPFMIGAIDYIRTLDTTVLGVTIWSLTPSVQYFLGWRYFRSGHLNKVYYDSRRSDIWMPPLWSLAIILTILVGILTAINFVIWENILSPRLFQSISREISFEGLRAYIGLYWMYSWFIIMTNMFIFCLVFGRHVTDMRSLSEDLGEKMIWRLDQSTMNEITRRVAHLRFVINDSISNLENFYTTITIIGSVAIGPMIEFKVWDVYSLYYLIIWGILQVIFMYYIYLISAIRGSLQQFIRSPGVMDRYLTRIRAMHNVEVLREELQSEYSTETPIQSDSESTEVFDTQERMILDKRSISVRNIERMNRINSMKISAYCPVKLGDLVESNELDELPPQILSPVQGEQIVIAYRLMAGMDWQILNQYLKESWASFSLLGINFGDSGVIQKGVSVMGGIIVASSYLNSITWISQE